MPVYRVRASDPKTGVQLSSDLKWHQCESDIEPLVAEFSDRDSADDFAAQLNREHPHIEVWLDAPTLSEPILVYPGRVLAGDKRAMDVYGVANLISFLVVLSMVTIISVFVFSPPAWYWFFLGPLFFVLAGFLQERILSLYVNRVVQRFLNL